MIENDAIIKGSLNHDHDHHSAWCKELLEQKPKIFNKKNAITPPHRYCERELMRNLEIKL